MAGEARVPFVGLTGGIAAGKSEALEAFERLGAATLSTDAVVRDLLTGGEVRDMLVERFGDAVAPDGEIDRGAVAEVVFGDDEQRKWLEGLLWPRVGQRMWEWRQEVDGQEPPPPAAVVEVPLLFESGMEDAFDETIAVVADEPMRGERAGGRGHLAVGGGGGADARGARRRPRPPRRGVAQLAPALPGREGRPRRRGGAKRRDDRGP